MRILDQDTKSVSLADLMNTPPEQCISLFDHRVLRSNDRGLIMDTKELVRLRQDEDSGRVSVIIEPPLPREPVRYPAEGQEFEAAAQSAVKILIGYLEARRELDLAILVDFESQIDNGYGEVTIGEEQVRRLVGNGWMKIKGPGISAEQFNAMPEDEQYECTFHLTEEGKKLLAIDMPQAIQDRAEQLEGNPF